MRRPETPRGFRDVLPLEALERAAIADSVSGVMAAWGYVPVETPAVEEYDTLADTAGVAVEGKVFRLFDADGRLLALRPEMTVPIARMAASRLDVSAVPLRLRYTADVFREEASLRGRSRQFTQAGLELIGESGPAADAEVIAVLVEALSAAGLDEFVVGVGTVAAWNGLIERAGMDESWAGALLTAAHERNVVGIDELAAAEGLDPRVADALRSVPRTRGGREALDACREALDRCGTGEALDDLERTWTLLERAGAADRVTLDFGVMRSFDYYTGMVLEVYAPGIGLPLGGGGRYDGVLGRFGTPAPAAGFAVGVERLHIALAEQGNMHEPEPLAAVVGGEAAEVFAAAATLRADGLTVVAAPGRAADATRALASALRANSAYYASDGELAPLDRGASSPSTESEEGR